MPTFCTLFDSGYLTRGLAMYESLRHHCRDSVLYVLAMDSSCEQVLTQLKRPGLHVIGLADFEDEENRRLRASAGYRAYCWACASLFTEYLIRRRRLGECTYVDADILFFSDPKPLINEMPAGASILLTEHRFVPEQDISNEYGRFCVQFMTFRAGSDGERALSWWAARCREGCVEIPANGQFGDQKYLDDWPERFPGVHILQHPGGGVAPWNCARYEFGLEDGQVMCRDRFNKTTGPLVFFHYHALKRLRARCWRLSVYRLDRFVITQIYKPYLELLNRATVTVLKVDKSISAVLEAPEAGNYFSLKAVIKAKLLHLGTVLWYRAH